MSNFFKDINQGNKLFLSLPPAKDEEESNDSVGNSSIDGINTSQTNMSEGSANTSVNTDSVTNKSDNYVFSTSHKPSFLFSNNSSRITPKLFGSRSLPSNKNNEVSKEIEPVANTPKENTQERVQNSIDESHSLIHTDNDNAQQTQKTDMLTKKDEIEDEIASKVQGIANTSSVAPQAVPTKTVCNLPSNTPYPVSAIETKHSTDQHISRSYFLIINELEAKCNNLRSKIVEQNEQLAAKNSKLSDIKNTLKTITEKSKGYNSIMNKLQSDLVSLKDERISYAKNLKLVKEENYDNKGKIQLFKDDINDLSKKLGAYKNKFNSLKIKFEKQNLIIKNLESMVDDLSGNLSEEKLNTLSLTTKLDEKDKLYNEIFLDQLKDLKNKLFDKLDNEVIEIFRAETNSLSCKFPEQIKSLFLNFESKCSDLNTSLINTSESAKADAQQSVHKLIGKLDLINDNFNKKISPFNYLTIQVPEILKNLKILKNDVILKNFATIDEKSISSFQNLEHILTGISNKSAQLDSLKKEYDTRIKKYETQMNELYTEKNDLTKKLDQSHSQSNKLDKIISNYKLKEASLITNLDHANETILNLKKDFKKSTSAIETFKKEAVSEKNKYIDTFESHLVSHKQLLSLAQDEKIQMKSEFSHLQSKIKDLENYKINFEKIEDKYNSLALEKEKILEKLKKVSNDFQTLETSKREQCSKLDKEIKELNLELETTKSYLVELNECQMKLKHKEDLLTKEINDHKTDISKRLLAEDKMKEIERKSKEMTKNFKIKEAKFNNDSIALKERISVLENELHNEKKTTSMISAIENEDKIKINELNEKYLQKVKSNEELIIEKNNMLIKMKESERRSNDLNTQISNKIDENNQLKLKVSDLEEKLRQFRNDEGESTLYNNLAAQNSKSKANKYDKNTKTNVSKSMGVTIARLNNQAKSNTSTSKTKKRKLIIEEGEEENEDPDDEFSIANIDHPPTQPKRAYSKKIKSKV